jgi:hypothetical protein
MEATPKKTKKQLAAEKRLDEAGIRFTRGQLSNALFKFKESNKSSTFIMIDEFTSEQFRAMANYMKVFPNCTIFPDGSGKPCK